MKVLKLHDKINLFKFCPPSFIYIAQVSIISRTAFAEYFMKHIDIKSCNHYSLRKTMKWKVEIDQVNQYSVIQLCLQCSHDLESVFLFFSSHTIK